MTSKLIPQFAFHNSIYRIVKKTSLRNYFFFVFLLILVVFISTIHQFLTITKRADGEILIVEGWIMNKGNSLKQAIDEFDKGNYKFLVTVGGPSNRIKRSGEYYSYAELAMQKILEYGFNKESIISISVPYVQKHRTFSSALACHIWLNELNLKIKAVNVFTYGAHARKTYTVFKQALEPEITVGVISAKPSYKLWWLDVRGWRGVIFSFAKYIEAIL